ncbi:MAG: Xaa-Pro peptidase family protein [Candidatus Woesearchaeota archaeon]
MRRKRRSLRKHAQKKRIHSIILFNLKMNAPDPNFYHLTGFDGYGCLLLLKDREILFVPKMEYERAKREVKGMPVRILKGKLSENIRGHVRGKAVGIDYNAVTLNFMKSLRKEFRKKRFVDVSSVLLELRKTKTEREEKNLRKACRMSDNILRKCINKLKRKGFRTEQDVADFLEQETMRKGCELSFKPIVASGANSAEAHHPPQNRKLRKGFCIIDFGVRYKGYCSDTTRTIYMGEPSRKEMDAYDHLLKVQKSLINGLEEGKKASRVYDECIEKLGDYSEYFTHGLGHGVGVEIHELPNITANSKDLIEAGAVFTIEPGVYFPGKFGIRIEDTVLMGETPVVLTKISKELKTVKRTEKKKAKKNE